MNRFMGGFAVATAILGAAETAGHVWRVAGSAGSVVFIAGWLLVSYSRRGRAGVPPAQHDPYAEPQVFAGRQDRETRPLRNRR